VPPPRRTGPDLGGRHLLSARVSTRRVEKLIGQLGITSLSKSQVREDQEPRRAGRGNSVPPTRRRPLHNLVVGRATADRLPAHRPEALPGERCRHGPNRLNGRDVGCPFSCKPRSSSGELQPSDLCGRRYNAPGRGYAGSVPVARSGALTVAGRRGRRLLVAVPVAFGGNRGPSLARPTRARPARQPAMVGSDHQSSDLESVLGSRPRGFESRILRQRYQRKRPDDRSRGRPGVVVQSQFQSQLPSGGPQISPPIRSATSSLMVEVMCW